MQDLLDQRARQTPNRPALICGDDRWTFAELRQQVEQVAETLRTFGVMPGERVALLAHNGAAFVQVVHAVGRCGAILVPLNVRLTTTELEAQLRAIEAGWLIVDAAFPEQGDALQRRVPALQILALERVAPPGGVAESPASAAEVAVDPAAVHTILFTSGTSGRPKGALVTVGSHYASALASTEQAGLGPDDCWLIALPLYHVGGLSILFRSLVAGFPVVVHDAFDPARANGAIEEEGVRIVSVVARMLEALVAQRGGRPYPQPFRHFLLGGGPVPAALLERCTALGVSVLPTYGLTETASQIATLAPADGLRKRGTVGRPLPQVEIRIAVEGRACAPNEPGEILVRGPMVTAGYYGDPAATARALRDGWLHTGDIGALDPEGILTVFDRREDLILSGGENIYPAEIEAVLLSHQAVAEAGVIGVPDPTWGARPVAFVSLRAGAGGDVAAIERFCADRLAAYKRPLAICLMPALPRNAAGKLLRLALREQWEAARRDRPSD